MRGLRQISLFLSVLVALALAGGAGASEDGASSQTFDPASVLRDSDSFMDCDLLYTGGDNTDAETPDKVTCIKPSTPGGLDFAKEKLAAQGFEQVSDIQIEAEFCREDTMVAVFWFTGSVTALSPEAEKREMAETAPIGVWVDPEACAGFFAQGAKLVEQLGISLLPRDRAVDVFLNNEEGGVEYEPSDANRLIGFKFTPSFGDEVEAFRNLFSEFSRIGFVRQEANPQLGGQGFCRAESREALFLTPSDDGRIELFDFFSGRFNTDLNKLPFLVQLIQDTECDFS